MFFKTDEITARSFSTASHQNYPFELDDNRAQLLNSPVVFIPATSKIVTPVEIVNGKIIIAIDDYSLADQLLHVIESVFEVNNVDEKIVTDSLVQYADV